MTGELTLSTSPHHPQKHDHLALEMTGGAVAIFRDPRQFGRVRFDSSPGIPDWWKELPPEPLDPAFTAAYMEALLRRHPKQPLKALLLDQSCFPGIGNWMADEILWQRRLPPQTVAEDLSSAEVRKIHQSLRKVCQTAVATIGDDWSDPPKNWLFHQRWASKRPCPRCGTPLHKEQIRGRTACWCPSCQHARHY